MVPQKNELHALETMIASAPDAFWALTESLLDDNFIPTENILVIKSTGKTKKLTVKEGNRRIAALKLVHGLLKKDGLRIPNNIAIRMDNITDAWKSANNTVPCLTYEQKDASFVDKLVTLTHGKGQKAGRDPWNAVATARHNRDVNHASEPALDLLAKYLRHGKNLSPDQAERWSGEYPLSILDEISTIIAPRVEATNAVDLASQYPDVKYKQEIDVILRDIGLKEIKFPHIRDKSSDFAADRGIPSLQKASITETTNDAEALASPGTVTPTDISSPSATETSSDGSLQASTSTSSTTSSQAATGSQSGSKKIAVAINDPKSVKRALNQFTPKGKGREKVVSLLAEARKLDISKTPMAFCFVLRSMFEISAKAYCGDHKDNGGPSATKDGIDRKLVDVLRAITNHLTNDMTDLPMKKHLHGAMSELAKPSSLLSVESMNQLIHNPRFSITAGDVAIMFGNVLPLLEKMNS